MESALFPQRLVSLTRLTLAVILTGTAGIASGHEAGDIIVRAGVVSVNPNDSSGDLRLDGAELADTGVTVNNNAQLMLTATYMFAPNFGVELLAATPFEHDIKVQGLDAVGVPTNTKIATVNHLPPTVTAVWYPLDSSSAFQPFLGLGFNYTLFFDESETRAARAALDADKLKLDNSFGLAARAGFDYQLNDNLSINLGVWYIDINTDARLETALGTVKVDVDIDPLVYGLGIGYAF